LLLRTLSFVCPEDVFEQELDYQTSGDITGDFTASVCCLASPSLECRHLNRECRACVPSNQRPAKPAMYWRYKVKTSEATEWQEFRLTDGKTDIKALIIEHYDQENCLINVGTEGNARRSTTGSVLS
jgi:hypothetical protein